MKFGHLIFRKIFKFVATGCQILRLNAPTSISAGALPQTPLGDNGRVEGEERRGNKKGGYRKGPQKLVHTPMSEILKNTLIPELIWLVGAALHRRLPRAANTLASPLIFLIPIVVGGWGPLPSEICEQSDPPLRNTPTSTISAYNVSTVRYSEKPSIMTNRKSTTGFRTVEL